MNLSEIKPELDHDMFCKEVEKEFINHYKDAEVLSRVLDHTELENNAKINEIYSTSTSWEWLHGTTPQFTNSIETRFQWGIIDFNFDVEKSKKILKIIIFLLIFF